jgi:hypothetical protein
MTDLAHPSPSSSWADVVPQHPKDLLKSAAALKGDNLVVRWVRSALQGIALLAEPVFSGNIWDAPAEYDCML